MWERLSRFDTMPGDIKIPAPAAWPTEPVQPMTRWTVRLAANGGDWASTWAWDTHVWAHSSSDAVARAESAFYGSFNASLEERRRLPLRVVAVLQKGV